MPAEEVGQHHRRREEVSDQHAPPGDRVGHRRPEEHHDRNEENLEGQKKDKNRDQQRAFALRHVEQPCAAYAEDDKRGKVQRRVPHYRARMQRHRQIALAVQDHLAEQTGSLQRMAAPEVECQKPQRDG